ncbi:cell envelope integrity protein CreD [Chitinilyticum aquatile]|uniref:cell envelope integrity protein CreD n=1 Tax=Chitinilyticum aquatile TaxID=362520 RepID=UPI0004276E46|nr:cell envelope integrity protein CreD [Chitinilyticum aquatile]
MKLAWKILTCLALIAGMMLVIGMVRSLLNERQGRAEEVRQEIAQFSAGEQVLNGPFLVIPYTETVSTLQETQNDKGVTSRRWEESTHEQQLVLEPEQFSLDGKLEVETLKRGIFEAPVYRSQLQLGGHFFMPAADSIGRKPVSEKEKIVVKLGEPYLALGMSDVRGIQQLGGKANGNAAKFAPGTELKALPSGVHAPLAWSGEGGTLPFALELKLAGTTQLLLQPVGKESSVALSGNWPHPSFSGNFAPVSRSVNAQGFSAKWQTSQLATGGAQLATGCNAAENDGSCSSPPVAHLGLRLLDPVDRYVLNERTLKYAELFILLMFGAVFLMEVLKRVQVHPVQYAMVGLSLALFFLLTLSLSEHLGFALAYLLAAAASVLLLGYYVSYMLAGWRRGLGFAGILAALYGLLYGILQSEDMALLMGSLTLFGLLAAVMVLTRKLDWQALGNRTAQTAKPVAKVMPQPEPEPAAS